MGAANEILQWTALGLLLIGVLTLFRQWGHIIGEDMGDIVSTSGPPLESRLRPSVRDELIAALPVLAQNERSLLVFVAENCPTCQVLLEGMRRREYSIPDSVGVGLIALNPTQGFQEAIQSVRRPFLADDGKLWKAMNIRATPFIVAIDTDGRVRDKEVGLGITTIVDRLAGDESAAHTSAPSIT